MDAREIAHTLRLAEKKKNPHPNDCAEWYPPPPPPGSAPPPPPPPLASSPASSLASLSL